MKTIGPQLFQNVLRALETEPREPTAITGAAGVSHKPLALGVDDKRRRLVLILNEYDAEAVALINADIQAAFGAKLRVTSSFPMMSDDLTQHNETDDDYRLNPIRPDLLGLEYEFKWLVYIARYWREIGRNLPMLLYPEVLARNLGVCPLPFFRLSHEETIYLTTRRANDLAREVLIRLGVLQYFFPPSDTTILGLVDKGHRDPRAIPHEIQAMPLLGHPLGGNELATPQTKLVDLVEALRDMGY